MAYDLATLGSIIGALGVGSVAGQWLAGSKDRRSARADALAALAQVESARWATNNEPDVPDFLRAMRELRTRALIARLPRRAVDVYLELATAAHMMSVEDAAEEPDPEFSGGIDAHLGQLVRDSARVLADTIWSVPLWRSLRMRHQLAALERRRATMSKLVQGHLIHAQQFNY